MIDWSRLLGFRSRHVAVDGHAPVNSPARLLAITSDEVFYSKLVDIGTGRGWEVRRAVTVHEGLDIVRTFGVPLVILDWAENRHDWREGLDRISGASNHPCVLLASRVVDDNLRQAVLRHHGYDVLPRAAERDDIMRAVEFAWFWVTRSWNFREAGTEEETRQ